MCHREVANNRLGGENLLEQCTQGLTAPLAVAQSVKLCTDRCGRRNTEFLIKRFIDPCDAKVGFENDHRLRHRLDHRVRVVPFLQRGRVERFQFAVAVHQLIIRRREFLVNRLQFLFRCLQLFVRALKLLVAGQQFFLAGFELFLPAFVLLQCCAQLFSRRLKFCPPRT